jgi:hypothetical protein
VVWAQVNYVGKGARCELPAELHGCGAVLTKILGTTWLWDRVRVRAPASPPGRSGGGAGRNGWACVLFTEETAGRVFLREETAGRVAPQVVGGAYGVFGVYDWRRGAMNFVSYRDPKLDETLQTYDSTADYVSSAAAAAVTTACETAVLLACSWRPPDSALGATVAAAVDAAAAAAAATAAAAGGVPASDVP